MSTHPSCAQNTHTLTMTGKWNVLWAGMEEPVSGERSEHGKTGTSRRWSREAGWREGGREGQSGTALSKSLTVPISTSLVPTSCQPPQPLLTFLPAAQAQRQPHPETEGAHSTPHHSTPIITHFSLACETPLLLFITVHTLLSSSCTSYYCGQPISSERESQTEKERPGKRGKERE